MNPITKSHVVQKVVSSRSLLHALEEADLNLSNAIESVIPAGYMVEFAEELEIVQRELNKRIVRVRENLNYWELELLNDEK